ncbi:MBL fold metallo-hydrolase [Jannaschia sp. LMIT008]|uniref:MBL fold metallo-hydrolase n=1 Tax=Jannaschia maritima TaxID=3032585 RepID=UPI0028109E2A|nr:MBL fold metallo-hydrolase [Jannaschia sp. LMIT008]
MTARGPWHHGSPSDHFDGTRFFNPSGPSHPDALTSARWIATRRQADWPPAPPVAPAVPDARVDDLRVTFVGHATVLVQVAGRNVVLDPLWSDRASPVAWVGPQRWHAPGVAWDDLPPVDLAVVTHSHYDHMDAPTLRGLRDAHPCRCVAPLGNDVPLRAEVPGLPVDVLDWGGTLDLGGGFAITALPCRHWSQRYGADRDLALWASFLLRTPVGGVLLMGDTGFDGGRPYATDGPVRLAAIPIGAYAPRWHMEHEHQDPAQAAEGFRLCGARHAVATHWGCFRMTDEGRLDPPRLLRDALSEAERDRFRVPEPGVAWDVPA